MSSSDMSRSVSACSVRVSDGEALEGSGKCGMSYMVGARAVMAKRLARGSRVIGIEVRLVTRLL